MNFLEEARLSGLVFGEISSGTPQWATTKEKGWPRDVKLPKGHALVVVQPTDRNPKEELVVLVGGETDDSKLTSVLALKGIADERQGRHWQEGAPLNQGRYFLSAVVCNGHVYAIAGVDHNGLCIDTVERISLVDLISSFSTGTKGSFRDHDGNQEKGWETLKCRLSDYRCECSAVVVHNRYIVVAGGRGWYSTNLSSVEIIDTATSKQKTNEPCSMLSGPPLTVPREWFAMEVIGRRVYAVGGYVDYVEYLDLSNSGQGMTPDNKNTSSTKFWWSSLSWTKHKQLKLSESRLSHANIRAGSCLVVYGGTVYRDNGFSKAGTIEVLDTKRNKVWTLPHRTSFAKTKHILVSRSNGIAVIGFAAKGSWNEFTF